MTLNDLKTAWKVFLRRKFFTAVSLFGITFTLLVLDTGTAVLDHVFGKHAPETRPERTLGIFKMKMQGPNFTRSGAPTYGLLDSYARDLPGVERMSIHGAPQRTVSFQGGGRRDIYLKRTDSSFWRILEFSFLQGGPFTADDEALGRRVAVINESTRSRFFPPGKAIGQVIEADGQAFTVVGVVEDVPILRQVPFSDVWVPISSSKTDAYKKDMRGAFLGLFLLKEGASAAAVKAEMASRLARAEMPDREFTSIEAFPETYFESSARDLFNDSGKDASTSLLLVTLMVFAGLFMILPALNLMNLTISRTLERAPEIGVRKAFGASSQKLIAQFLVENVLLTLAGGALALLLSLGVFHLVNTSALVPYADLSLNGRIVLWGFAFALFFGVLSGVYPAYRLSRLNPVVALRGGSR